MHPKLYEISLHAGGSHYPTINPQMQEAFARLLIDECIKAVESTDTKHALTTYDHNMVQATIQKSVEKIKQIFGA